MTYRMIFSQYIGPSPTTTEKPSLDEKDIIAMSVVIPFFVIVVVVIVIAIPIVRHYRNKGETRQLKNNVT